METLGFHPLVRRWFESSFRAPTAIQREGWRSISSGRDTLIAAPTGSGKTLAAFLWSLDELVREAASGTLEDAIHTVYVSPLKALGNDIEKNLALPLAGIRTLADEAGVALSEIRVAVRTGDTSQRERQVQLRRPPHVLITTPESLYILLTAAGSRRLLAGARRVIVDEIHAIAQDKRGLHLALSLERLDENAGRPLPRIGLSATQKPIDEVARLLVGSARLDDAGNARCAIVDSGHRRPLDLRIEIPDFEIGPIASHELHAAIHDRIATLAGEHRSTIVFVNTRRLVERVAHALGERLGKDKVAAHHGSLSREARLDAEQKLKSGEVPVVVATASLELGIDVGHVDLVCQIGVPRAISTFLQRVGRSGHWLGAVPRGIVFPVTRDELLQAGAIVRAVYAGELDALKIPPPARDVLAQQIVASVAASEMDVDRMFDLVRRAFPYREITRAEFDAIVEMLSEGVSSRRGRRGAHLHFDRVNGVLRPRRGARLAAITSGGAIPDTADYDVVLEPEGTFLGKVNEDFAVESLAGDIFQLGNHSWRVKRVEFGRIRVDDAGVLPPTIPFWLGEGPGRTRELSAAVADLRVEIAARRSDIEEATRWLVAETRVSREAAMQMIAYVSEGIAMLGAVPTLDTVIAERFFDEAGGMQLVIHAPFGARVNRALGLALRKRFCVSFDFELQAAATDDGVLLSLGEQHSFPLDSVFSFVRSSTFRDDLVQAALQSPMFMNRWRWNASRALVLMRFRAGKKVPLAIQRMQSEDLLAAVFPESTGCQDNRMNGHIDVPDHPLVAETIDDCLNEAMDADGLALVLEAIESGRIRTIAVETPAPSPFAHEILGAGPYAYLDDAPLEERRARAVSLRRTDGVSGGEIGALDKAAIDEVRRQAWPEAATTEEVHDTLLTLGVLPLRDASAWQARLEELLSSSRATRIVLGGRAAAFVATERVRLVRLLFPDAVFEPAVPDISIPSLPGGEPDDESAALEIVRGWMHSVGPVTARALAARIGINETRIMAALARLESQGCVLQGSFTDEAPGETEWCERGLLARIHRLTVGRLRREIEPVSAADFMRFLLRWQHVQEGTRLHGREGVRSIVAQLGGLELPATSWERDVLPARIEKYDGNDLEQLCLAGEVAWGRLVPTLTEDDDTLHAPVRRRRSRGPTRSAPIAFCLRADLPELLAPIPAMMRPQDSLSSPAAAVLEVLETRGASFLSDIARSTGKLAGEVEDALWELVACGLVTGDGLAGLRALLLPDDKKRGRREPRAEHGRDGAAAALGLRGARLRAVGGQSTRRSLPVGRWSLLRADFAEPVADDEADARTATRLLHRYGVVFRDVVTRERGLPPWRRILWALRRMEARGVVRGGRFVSGFVGEQFALPHAVDALRAVRRDSASDQIAIVAAADPLNLVGVLLPGPRISPFSTSVIAYRDGNVIEVGELGEVRSRLQGFGGRFAEPTPRRRR
ncbi:MAG TPA: DEAD/DEAH box helicase [Candidatus Limnocylindrales bacterium]|nr:DEAD/DEAH box helicase [Candidatus Limnocylindrales bacterium]